MTEPTTTPEAEAPKQALDLGRRLRSLHRKAHDDHSPERGTARKALAQLRRGLTDADALPAYEVLFTERLVAEDVSPKDLKAAAQAASLYGLYVQGLTPKTVSQMPKSVSGFRRHSLGTSARLLRGKLGNGQDSLDRRFNALLDSDPRDLFVRLRHLFRLLHSHNIPVNFNRLLTDLQRWSGGNPDTFRAVRREWAEDYWRPIEVSKAATN